ncbi:MAG: hypothetical protein B7Z72_02355, partial [Gemmatimonadetes bacterium 21-71-4]
MRLVDAVRGVCTPQYVFRPGQIVRRMLWRGRRRDRPTVTARLAWGMPIRCYPSDPIGLGMQQLGVFELRVAEILARLADPGETALDVGANVGQMTALLALRLGPSGRVVAFEPADGVRATLEQNAAAWRAGWPVAAIDVRPVALSDRDGAGELLLPAFYDHNRGLARVAAPGEGDADGGSRQPLRLARLDGLLGADTPVGVMKIDVEGHEGPVLRGAGVLLAAGRIRDIVFEDHGGYPTDVSRLLEGFGYRVF